MIEIISKQKKLNIRIKTNSTFYHMYLLGIVFSTILYSINGFSVKTTGRLTLGGVAITERFKTDEFGSKSNDHLLSSSRFFYKVSDLGSDKWELTTDLRDKHDFFGKLTKEQLALESKNDFQVRQMTAHWLNPEGAFSSQIGRFQLPEAGSVFVDGVDLEFRFTPYLKSGGFSGFNPKSIEDSDLNFDKNATQNGVFLTYQSHDEGWDKNLYFSHGLVEQTYKKQKERSFFFHNLIYQWEANSRWISYLNYDLVPEKKVQTANMIYQQNWTKAYNYELGYLHIDLLEYRRRQGLLEKLDPSPYRESHFQLQRKNENKSSVAIEFHSGLRDADHLKRYDAILGFVQNELLSKNLDLYFKLGSRNNFTSKDKFINFGIGYYSKFWESSIDTEYQISANNDGTTTHPTTIELALTNYYSKELFLTASFERAADENVTITSTFIKFGYRFGNQEIPPVRDGAPPRGPI